jgi:hypothetical protein
VTVAVLGTALQVDITAAGLVITTVLPVYADLDPVRKDFDVPFEFNSSSEQIRGLETITTTGAIL